MINKNLVKKQGLSTEDILELEELHKTKDELFNLIEKTTDKEILKLFGKLLQSLEYDMQRVWKFTQSSDYHTWWLRAPKCTCPKIDNADNYGTPYRITVGSCPLHWNNP